MAERGKRKNKFTRPRRNSVTALLTRQGIVSANGTALASATLFGPTQCNTVENGTQSGDQEAFSTAGTSANPAKQLNLVEQLGQKMKKAMLTKGPDAFPAFMSSLTLIIDVLNVIDLTAMNVLKLEVADCMQIFRTAKKHSAKDVLSLDDMLLTELKIPPARVIKDGVERIRSVVVFLKTFFEELRAPGADPSSCAATAYAKSVKDRQSIVLQYVFSESVPAVNNRMSIATNLIRNGPDNARSKCSAEVDSLFETCYNTLTQCVLLLDAILVRNGAFELNFSTSL